MAQMNAPAPMSQAEVVDYEAFTKEQESSKSGSF